MCVLFLLHEKEEEAQFKLNLKRQIKENKLGIL